MSECIRTGADVYLVDYDAIIHCDLFELDNVYVMHYCGTMNYEPDHLNDNRIDLIVNDVYFHLESAKVIIASIEECTKTNRLKNYMGGEID